MAKRGNPQKITEADELGSLYAHARDTLTRAGRSLHDDVGSSLTAAGFQLQLLRSDIPQSADQIEEIVKALDHAFERVRIISQELNPSPVQRAGLKQALLLLAEKYTCDDRQIIVNYAIQTPVSLEVASPLYEATESAVLAAVRHGANSVKIFAKGEQIIQIRIIDDGKKARKRDLRVAERLARQAGLTFKLASEKSTIVLIQYAFRRPSRR